MLLLLHAAFEYQLCCTCCVQPAFVTPDARNAPTHAENITFNVASAAHFHDVQQKQHCRSCFLHAAERWAHEV
jgi:hypothetical protein